MTVNMESRELGQTCWHVKSHKERLMMMMDMKSGCEQQGMMRKKQSTLVAEEKRDESESEVNPAATTCSLASICSSFSFVKQNYNFDLPTSEVYTTQSEVYIGQYKRVRERLDKSFHGCYTEDRQLVQDQIISYVLRSSGSSKRQERPCIIFTAGAMGSGKSHTMDYLRSQNILDLESYVVVDQDEIRSFLPEWQGYVEKSEQRAGSLLQKESGYMCEIALTESLNGNRNIIFDSSLRDSKWWKHEFDRIRAEYPEYRIAIIYMHTDLETTIKRTERRALKTRRSIPASIVTQSYEQCANSFEQLKTCAHFTAVVDTTDYIPKFVSPSMEEFVDQLNNSATLLL